MSRLRLTARNKVVQKITKDGLVERDVTVGGETRVSMRNVEYALRDNPPEGGYSQFGNTLLPDRRRKRIAQHSHAAQRQPEAVATPDAAHTPQQEGGNRQRASVCHPEDPPALFHDAPPPDSIQPQDAPRNVTPNAPEASANAGRRHSRQEAARQQANPPEPSSGAPPSEARAAEHPPILRHDALHAPEKASALRFAREDAAPVSTRNRTVERAERRLARSSDTLERARENMPTRRKFRMEIVAEESTGKVGRKLTFGKELKSQREHIKGPLPLRPVAAGANAAIALGHRKIYQAEHENVSTEVAHKAELFAEGGVRSALRARKTAPYRKLATLERKTSQRAAKLSFEKAQAGNPKLKRKAAARAMQRKKIRDGYAKAARAAGNLAKRAGGAAVDTLKTAVAAIAKHPAAVGIGALVIVGFFSVMSLVGLAANVGTSSLSGYVTSSYLAENADIENAELSYTVWETALREEIEAIKTSHPGYDQYVLDCDLTGISHDPLALLAYLTAVYQDYTFAEIEGDMRALFDAQYQLSIVPTVETRYNDPGDSDHDGDYEPYDWHILTVTLTATPLTDIIDGAVTDEQREHYTALMETRGGRQYAGSPFAFDWSPYITCLYGWRPDPFTGESDYHTGIDIGIPTGTPIIAAHDGVVTVSEWGTTGYGRQIVIADDNGISTRYAHCDTLLVTVGQEVEQGEVIAASGSTGYSTGPHLHYEVMLDGQTVNPIFFASTNSNTEETA
jgi:murein DD-endopeptidase MepM/ murein hydrolase activator NlpD